MDGTVRFAGKDMSQYLSSAEVVPRLRAEFEFENCARPEDMLIEKDWSARCICQL